MGGFISTPLVSDSSLTDDIEDHSPSTVNDAGAGSSKRARISSPEFPHSLLPGLPDDVSIRCLARVSRSYHNAARLVSRGWAKAFTSCHLYTCRRDMAVTEEWLYVLMREEQRGLVWRALDPLRGSWLTLPRMPDPIERGQAEEMPSSSSLWWNPFSASRARVSGLFRLMEGSVECASFCGATPVVLGDTLYVVGGFFRGQAIPRVLLFSPQTHTWSQGVPMGTPRAYCKAGAAGGKLFVVGGVHREGGGLQPLVSGEVFDPVGGEWAALPDMTFKTAPALPAAFLAGVLLPTATGLAVLPNSRLAVTQSLYHWPFFIDIGGEIFDPEAQSWEGMPRGMSEGWPVKQGGSKLSAVVGGRVFSLQPDGDAAGARLLAYAAASDSWQRCALQALPLELHDADLTFLLASLNSALTIVFKDSSRAVVVSSACVGSEGDAAGLKEGRWQQVARRRFGRSELLSCATICC